MEITYDIDEDEDLLLAELEQALNAPEKHITEELLPDDLSVEDLGVDDDEILEAEAKKAMEDEYDERIKHIAIQINSDGSIVYQSGTRKKEIDIEHFLTKEEKDEYAAKNMNLIHRMAHKYHDNHSSLEEYDEFFGEATLGFTKALNTYDIASKVPFANYACFCMDNVLRTYCMKFKKVTNPDIIASLDETIAGGKTQSDGDRTLGDIFVDSTQASVEEQVEEKMTEENLQDVFSRIDKLLNPLQRFCVSTYYGINDCEQMNKAQMSKMLNMPVAKINEALKQASDLLREQLAFVI